MVLLVCSRQGTSVAIEAYMDVASSLGLILSFTKAKFMVIVDSTSQVEKLSLAVGSICGGGEEYS